MDENEVLARTWLATSMDPVIGPEQKSENFSETVRLRFIERAPFDTVTTEGRYDNQTKFSIKHHFGDMSPDIQKF